MVSKQSGKENEDAGADADVDAGVVSSPRPVRTSDRLRKRPKSYNRYVMFPKSKRSKTKTRTAASQIAKMLNTRQNNSDVIRFLLWSSMHI